MYEREYILAITGASGAIYGIRLFEKMARIEGAFLHIICSQDGKEIMVMETGFSPEQLKKPNVRIHDAGDMWAPVASGSYHLDGMVICPCTMRTLGAIANGISQNLIHRAADVCLKEGRMLILVPRETPLNRVHLSNMLKVLDAGGVILPAMPSFYHRPGSIDELADTVVDRVIDRLGIENQSAGRWKGTYKSVFAADDKTEV